MAERPGAFRLLGDDCCVEQRLAVRFVRQPTIKLGVGLADQLDHFTSTALVGFVLAAMSMIDLGRFIRVLAMAYSQPSSEAVTNLTIFSGEFRIRKNHLSIA